MGKDRKAKRKIGFGLGAFEVAAAFAGLIVVLGIWLESRSEIIWSFRHNVWPSEASGAILVGIGVFAEVAITALAAREARRADLDAEERIAKLNAETEQLRLLRTPRSQRFELTKFIGFLQTRPKGTVEIMFQPEDGEASDFAFVIWRGLSTAEWSVLRQPIPVPGDFISGHFREFPPEFVTRFTAVVRAGGQPTGVSIVTSSAESDTFLALWNAFLACQLSLAAGPDKTLPENVFRLVIAPKP